MANGSRHSMHIVEESTYGTTPTSPTMETLRHNSTTLGLSKDAIQSEELRSDRQLVDVRHGVKKVDGDVGIELSYGSFDTLLKGAMLSDWVGETPASGTDQIKTGTTRLSYTIERFFEDLASGDKYHVHTGCEVNSLNLTISPNAIVTGSFSFLGQDLNTSATEISGATITDPLTTSPMDAFSGSLNEGGSNNAVITEISFNLENGLEARNVVGSDLTLEPSSGRSNVSGSVTAYFEDDTMYNKFVNETDTSLDFTLLDPAGNQYKFDMPNIKYMAGKPDVSDDGSIQLSMDFQALYDETEDTNLIIERTGA